MESRIRQYDTRQLISEYVHIDREGISSMLLEMLESGDWVSNAVLYLIDLQLCYYTYCGAHVDHNFRMCTKQRARCIYGFLNYCEAE